MAKVALLNDEQDDQVLHTQPDLEDTLQGNANRTTMTQDKDSRKNIINEFLEKHEKRDIRRFPMSMAKYVQTMHSNYITGQMLVLKVVREDYHYYELNDYSDADITEEWIHASNNKGLVAYVEFWKREDTANNF